MAGKYDLLKTGSKVSFSVIAPEILTSAFSGVLVNGTMSYALAMKISPLPGQLHDMLYPYMKQNGVLDDPASYEYVSITKPSGEETVLGFPWINESTITQGNYNRLVYTINNVNGLNDAKIIDQLLKQNGYLDFSSSVS